MAKRKRFGFARRRVSRRMFRKTRSSRRSSSNMGDLGGLVAAALYGALRGKIAVWIQPISSKLPLGSYTDEVGMLGVNWAAKKFIGNKVPMVSNMAKSGMQIEAAQIGYKIGSGLALGGSSSGNGINFG